MDQLEPDEALLAQHRGLGHAAHRRLLWAGLILLITFVTYLPALRDGFVWDDYENVAANQSLHTLDGLKQIWVNPHASYQYYPLTYTSFWIEFHLWGLRPAGYHLVNILLHALNALLLGILLESLAVPGAWLAALIFAVHPVHVESVAWITERKNVLSGFFFLASFLAYFRFTAGVERRWRWYALSLGLFLCALLGKTAAAVLPVAILLVLWWKQDRMRRADLLPVLPFFLLSAALGWVTVWVEVHDVGAQGPEWAMTKAQRVLMAGRAVWFYASKLAWPHPLTFIYPRWQIDPTAWQQYLFPAAAAAVIGLLWFFRRRIGKGPLAAVLFFVCAAAPVPAFIKVYFMHYSYVADHFQYLASMGLIALAVAVISGGMRPPAARTLACGAAVLALSILSWRRCGAFRNDESVWRDTLLGNPDCWMAQNNLGAILFDRGEDAEAVGHFEQALRVKPDYAEAYNNLGTAMIRERKIPEAIGDYQQALRLKPDYANAHFNLGNALVQQGKVDEAIGHYRESLRINPYSAEAHYNLANALVAQGKLDEAIGHYQQALQLKPGYAEAHNNLGRTLLQQGNFDDAISHLQLALQIKPDYAEAHNNLGFALLQQHSLEQAIAHFQQAVQLKPDFAEAHFTLGFALLQEGKTAEAIAHFQQALRLKPDFAEAKKYLDLALAHQSAVAPGL
jgi:tetratricopeptide (TPR) repeat protein